ncbi:hypothetical protein [Celeribacter arenosi]|uniref:Uncharacterized protein n=1 Tax=Celeribacter arenosi TaxID=792649 RepID=A0ABP7JZ85_9RHOB
MTDYIAKARSNRVIALSHHQSGAVMFFPQDMSEERTGARQLITRMSKPMFVRSTAITASSRVTAPDMENVANEPYQLSADQRAA